MTPQATLAKEQEAIFRRQLSEAFESFERASEVMTRQYEALQRHVAALNLELDEKNRELSASLAERESLTLYQQSLLESLSDGVVAVDAAGVVTTVNGAAERMIGAKRETLMGRPIEDAFAPLARTQAVEDGVARWDGDVRQETVEFEDAGGRDRAFEVRFHPAAPPSGGQRYGLIVMRDVTELRRLERAANLRNRLTAMGEMAMNVAHEVRNPLGSIELFVSALRQDVGDAPDSQRLIDYISQGVRSIDNIVGNILMFARPIAPSLESVIPGELMDDVLRYARFHIEQKELRLDRSDRTEGARCLGDVELLKQVFLNLLLNATQAVETGARVAFTASGARRHVVFTVEDDGPGMDADTRARVFDPFYTTKRRGTGLGLTICHNIVQAHQGAIDCESEQGKGTRFTVRIPRA